MADPGHDDAARTAQTRDAYDRLAPVWSATTDDGPLNGGLERPALRALVPRPLAGLTVLDAGCGSGAQCAWLLEQGAEVIGVDLSPRMVDAARRRCGGRGRFAVATWRKPCPSHPGPPRNRAAVLATVLGVAHTLKEVPQAARLPDGWTSRRVTCCAVPVVERPAAQ